MTTQDQKVLEIVERLLANDPASKMLGMEIVYARHDHCQMSMVVRQDMANGYDVCHGGFIFALADTAVAFACAIENKVAVSASSEIEFLASASMGDTLIATADVIHHKGRNCFCNIMVKNEHGDLIALIHGRQVVLDGQQPSKD
ncbi:MAG: hotdog fold thioesterase [Psychrosphaera sp.]|nr:hotdog fold thioesterase [Psychrosphaera sp.]